MDEIPYIILTESPGMQVVIKGKGIESLKRVMEIFKEFCPKENVSAGILNKKEEFRIEAVIEVGKGVNVGEIRKIIEEKLNEIPELEFEIRELEKCGKHYMIPQGPTITLFGEPLVLIRKSRYLGYLKRICDLLNSGILPFLRCLGEEDGERIARDHREDVEEMLKGWEISKILKYLLNALGFLHNIPEYRIKERGREIEIEILPSTDWKELLEGLSSYLEGLILGLFSTLGVKVKEILDREGRVSSIKLMKKGKVFYVKIKIAKRN